MRNGLKILENGVNMPRWEIIRFSILAKAIFKDIGMDFNNPEHLKIMTSFLSGIAFVTEPQFSEEIIKHIERIKYAESIEEIIESASKVFEKSGYIDLV